MITQDHPLFFLKPLLEKERADFFFSKYIYKEDSLVDQRKIFSIEGSKLTQRWLAQELSALELDEELAFHSIVKVNGRNTHIPMIDLSLDQSITPVIVKRIKEFLSSAVSESLTFFDSGHSYHAYSLSLLTPQQWVEFMGKLLLINPKSGPQIVDVRWVGHRLISGYSSLRWSKNTKRHLKLPTKVSIFPEVKVSAEMPDLLHKEKRHRRN